MDSNNNIHEAAEFCRTLFHSAAQSITQKDPDRVAFLRSAQTDFNLWCSAIKATSKGKDSLDYRLRNHENVRKAICNLLDGLKASLGKYERSVIDSFEDHPAAPDSPSSTESYVSWEAISEEAGSEDVPTDGHNALPDANPFVAESILFITTTLDQLARFSLAIRKAGNKFRFARIDKECKANSLELMQFRDHLTLVILKGFPDPDPEAPLEDRVGRASDPKRLTAVQKRLIDANVLRRHRIEYITKSRRGEEQLEQRTLPEEGDVHREFRFSADAEGPRSVPVARSTISQGAQVPSTTQPEKQMVNPAARTATDIESRVDVNASPSHPVKSTVTNLTRVARGQAYPRSPESKLCPYCGDMLVLPPKEKRAAREQSWRAHVCQDVVPYTCFIEGCTAGPQPPEMFLTSEALLAHLIEKHSSISWICDFCSSHDGVTGQSAVFETAESWSEHMDKEHADLLKTHQRQVLADLNQQIMIGPFSCPLCDKIKTPTLEFTINDHILEHLHEFSLRALPASCGNSSDGLGSALQSRGSLSRITDADSPEDKPVLASLGKIESEVGDLIEMSNILFERFRVMGDFYAFDKWLQAVINNKVSQNREEKEFLCTHLPRLHQAINVYLEQHQEAPTDIRDSMLKNIKGITDDVLDFQYIRYINWSPGETPESSAFPGKPHQKSLCGEIWPVNAFPRSTARLTDRDKTLHELETKLLDQQRSLHLRGEYQPQGQLRIALEGGPGVGKTAIAIELARRLHVGAGSDRAIFWVDASSRASLEAAYRDIYSTIVEPRGPLMDPMHSLVHYLNWELRDQWVMILDGIQEQTLRCMVFEGLIPSGLNGSLLFTTRNASWQSLLGPSPFKSTIKVDRITSLGDELREAYCQTKSKERHKFLPIDALDSIVTKERVREEIGKFSNVSHDDADRGVRLILDPPNLAGQISSRKKIFAILALIDKLETIWDFIRQDIYDAHLPFEKQPEDPDWTQKTWPALLRRAAPGSRVRFRIAAFRGWTGAEITSFERTQWDVYVPIFTLSPRSHHHVLEDSVILPFVEDDEVKRGDEMDGFANVRRVKFHPSHYECGLLFPKGRENPSFAIKRLPDLADKAFHEEVQFLKSFSTGHFWPFVSLLGTYKWRDRYYYIFSWADGSLFDFWKGHPEPLAPKRDISSALWFSAQCLGIVQGIGIIHTKDMPDLDGERALSYLTRQNKSVHGDLKPENILWFNEFLENTQQDLWSLGCFKISISDLGHRYFHGPKSSAYTDSEDMGSSTTYQAPERKVKGEMTRSHDVWSLGCVLLEFANWYLGGYEGVKAFRKKRVDDDMQYVGGHRTDRFFNFMKSSQAMPNDDQGSAQIITVEKASVVWEFDKLSGDPYCSEYMVDFLKLIQSSLLRVEPQERRNCTEIAGSLAKLHENLQQDSNYGISRGNRPPLPPSSSPMSYSILMEGDLHPDSKKQILEDLPRATFRLSTASATVQELPENQGQEELGQVQHPHGSGRVAASENTAQTNKGHQVKRVPESQYTPVPIPQGYATVHGEGMAVVRPALRRMPRYQPLHRPPLHYQGVLEQLTSPKNTGLNVIDDEASAPVKISRFENAGRSAAELTSTEFGLGVDPDENESSDR